MAISYPDPKNPDMSPEAIDQRFRMVESLRKLCVSLKEAGARGPNEDARDGQVQDSNQHGLTDTLPSISL